MSAPVEKRKEKNHWWADMEVPTESFHRSSWDSRTCYPWRATNLTWGSQWLGRSCFLHLPSRWIRSGCHRARAGLTTSLIAMSWTEIKFYPVIAFSHQLSRDEFKHWLACDRKGWSRCSECQDPMTTRRLARYKSCPSLPPSRHNVPKRIFPWGERIATTSWQAHSDLSSPNVFASRVLEW